MYHSLLTGQDLHAPTNQIVENDTGSTIGALKVVTYNGIGTQGLPSIAINEGGVTVVRGVTQGAILTSEIGYITSLGFMIGNSTSPVNTSAWAEGAQLYSDISGNLSISVLGPIVATVYKQDAILGWIYVEGISSSGGGGGSGNVTGIPPTTVGAIAQWSNTGGTAIQDSPGTEVQGSGAIVAQGFITNQDVTGLVVVGSDQAWVAPSLNLTLTGSIDLTAGGQLIIVD